MAGWDATSAASCIASTALARSASLSSSRDSMIGRRRGSDEWKRRMPWPRGLPTLHIRLTSGTSTRSRCTLEPGCSSMSEVWLLALEA
jgi:hypothetical protein